MSIKEMVDHHIDRQLRKAGKHPEQILRRERDEARSRLVEITELLEAFHHDGPYTHVLDALRIARGSETGNAPGSVRSDSSGPHETNDGEAS